MKNKIISLILAGTCSFCLVSCGQAKNNNDNDLNNNIKVNTKKAEVDKEETQGDKNRKIVESKLKEAANDYLETLNSLAILDGTGREYTIKESSITGSTKENFLGGEDNYECTILYKVSSDDGRNISWFSLKIIVENLTDTDGSINPLGYTATHFGTKDNLSDELNYEEIPEGDFLRLTFAEDKDNSNDLIDKYDTDDFIDEYNNDGFTDEYNSDSFTDEYNSNSFTEEYNIDEFSEEYNIDDLINEYNSDYFIE